MKSLIKQKNEKLRFTKRKSYYEQTTIIDDGLLILRLTDPKREILLCTNN